MVSKREPTNTSVYWPRSYEIAIILIISSIFGALSYVPFVTAVLFYPAGSLVSASGYLSRSAMGDLLQIVYGLFLLEVGYIVGNKVAFRQDCSWILASAYLGSFAGYVVGLPGLETTSISGGIFLLETNPLNAGHLQSALFNSATLMGILVAGIAPSSEFQRLADAPTPQAGGGHATTMRLAVVFSTCGAVALLGYLLPSVFTALFEGLVGAGAASAGALYTLETNSVVLANPLLLFLALYALGGRVNAFRDERRVLVSLLGGVLVGALVGNPVGSYATVYVSTGSAALPNYLTNTASLATYLASVAVVCVNSALLGFAALCFSSVRKEPDALSGATAPLARI